VKEEFFYKGRHHRVLRALEPPQHTTAQGDLYRRPRRATSRSSWRFNTTTPTSDKILSFANNINTTEGGTHLIGFKSALTRTINAYAVNGNVPKNMQAKITGDDVREGFDRHHQCGASVNPQFEGQTKTKLRQTAKSKVWSNPW